MGLDTFSTLTFWKRTPLTNPEPPYVTAKTYISLSNKHIIYNNITKLIFDNYSFIFGYITIK